MNPEPMPTRRSKETSAITVGLADAVALGWSILPCGTNKKPILKTWKPFQVRLPTEQDISSWAQQRPAAWAFITGKLSGRITLDFDGEAGRLTLATLGLQPHRSTPSGGFHVDFRHPGWHVKTLNHKTKLELGRRWPGLDIRGDGGYVVFTGRTRRGDYLWLRDPQPFELDILAEDLRDFLGLLKPPQDPIVGRAGLNGKSHAKPVPACRVDAERLIRSALDRAGFEGRNNAGFWLACQARDNGYSQCETTQLLHKYADSVGNTNMKGEPEPYTNAEGSATVREAFGRAPRKPWAKKGSTPRATAIDSTSEGAESSTPPSGPVFPIGAIVGSIGDLARVLASRTEVPEEFYFISGLTILGSICSTDLTVKAGIEVEPRLYSVLLGESYEVKKSTAMKKTIEFFDSLRPGCKPDVLYGVGSAEGLARELRKHPKLLLAFDELRSFVDKCSVQNSALLPMAASLFDSHSWDNATKDSSISVRDARLSILGCCTTDTYSNMWTNNAIAIGFPNRLLVVCADRKRKIAWPETPDEGAVADLRVQIQRQIARLPISFEITPEAKAAWSNWYEALPSTEHSKRLDMMGFRLLGLVALATDKDRIDQETVHIVRDILDYELSVRRVTDPIDADSTIARLEMAIRRNLAGGANLSRRDLRRRVHGDRYGLWAFDAAIRNLLKAGDVICEEERYRAAELS